MKRSDFYFELPERLIAQTPAQKRDMSKLLLLDKNSGETLHRQFYQITDFLKEGDLLVLNNSKVIPARLFGTKKDTGANIEFLLLEDKGNDLWEVMVKPGKKVKIGTEVVFGDGLLTATILEVVEGGNRIVRLSYDGILLEILERIGNMPLPHYITERLEDKSRYQTVYSLVPGSSAAPTAGLHFTDALLDKIRAMGVKVAFVTLHVGLGTFRPVKSDEIEEHVMHKEQYYMPKETAELINITKQNGGRVIAVGTTSCRTLESVFRDYGEMKECSGNTDIFIYPGKKLNVIDAMITNFHLPESTLIMLISALAGRENVLNAYEMAIKEDYRFYSFGDAMFITTLEENNV